MNIAVFADLHGRILLCFKLVLRYEQETGEKIDLILQCGDLGVFPDIATLDKATLRHAEDDFTELGFSEHFMQSTEESFSVIMDLDCNMIAVRGNHEDHEYLDSLEHSSDQPLFSIDCYNRIFILKTGHIHTFHCNGESIRILGIGRAGLRPGHKGDAPSRFIQPYEHNRLINMERTQVDILISHDSPLDLVKPGKGMEEINYTLRKCMPKYHFYGHTGHPFSERISDNGVTPSIKMSDFEWKGRQGILKPDCMGILKWESRDASEFHSVSAKWLSEYTEHTWEHL